MRGKSIVALAGAIIFTLLLAAPALATDVYSSPVPGYGWMLQLRSATRTWDMTYRGFHASAVRGGVSVVNASDSLTYTGMSLKTLVGRIDDKDPATFNTRLATTGDGYNVEVVAVDGFVATYTSVEVATMGDTLVVADRCGGKRLNYGTLTIKNPLTDSEYASWKPVWPLKLVTSDSSITGSRRPGAVMRINIVPATQTAHATDVYSSPVPGYGWMLQLRSATRTWDMTYRGFHASAVRGGVSVVNASDSLTYTGMSLKTLVGRIDDKDPATFNTRLATTGDGYNVEVVAVDGFVATYTSVEVATMGDTLVVADRCGGKRLNYGTLTIKNPLTDSEYASWKPVWPLKLVTSDSSITGSRRPGAVMRINIVPATQDSAAPF